MLNRNIVVATTTHNTQLKYTFSVNNVHVVKLELEQLFTKVGLVKISEYLMMSNVPDNLCNVSLSQIGYLLATAVNT